MRFIDSLRFLLGSLQNLADSLEEDHLFETKKYFTYPNTFNLMKQKGVFPYNFVDDMEKLNIAKFPSKANFYDFNGESISDNDYKRAKAVWNAFNCKNLGKYSDVYLKTDVLLLSDVFESFRNRCLDKYNLDPCHYYTSSGLS